MQLTSFAIWAQEHLSVHLTHVHTHNTACCGAGRCNWEITALASVLSGLKLGEMSAFSELSNSGILTTLLKFKHFLLWTNLYKSRRAF